MAIRDAHGNTYTLKVNVDIVDDVPTISADVSSTTVRPASGAGNLEDGIAANFKNGEPETSVDPELPGWEGVTMTAAKVTYTVAGDNVEISKIEAPNNYKLEYVYTADADKGLTVADNGHVEINAIDETTGEGVVFDLGDKLAYGVNIDFGAFYIGGSSDDDKSEKALVTFYRDGHIVGSKLVEGNSSSGTQSLDASLDVVLGGFDKVVISAVHNGDTSDFTIQGIDFITKREDPVSISEGTVTAESGADGFAEEYQETNVRFDLGSMVQEDTLNEEGTSGTITVQIDGVKQNVTLELSEGSSGESILTGTIEGSNEQLFTATLDQDGHWTMEHYEQFQVPGEDDGWSNNFELAFKTEDSDGDIASTTVNVPLEVKEQEKNQEGDNIGNSNDTIVISDSNGVAGTVVAGDTGGMTEGTVVEKNYNICFVIDQSNGMFDNYIGSEGSRFDVARKNIINFIDTQIRNNEDFSENAEISVIPFHSWSESPITLTIENGNINDSAYSSFVQQLNSLNKPSGNGWPLPGGTNYEAGFTAAAEWFRDTATSNDPSNVETENITYFLTDGEPTANDSYRPTGDGYESKQGDVEGAWNGYQTLLDSASGMQVNAIGFGNLSDEAMWTLAMLDNTGTPAEGVAGNEPANGFLYYNNGKWAPNGTSSVYTEYEGMPSSGDETVYYTKLSDGTYQVLEWDNKGSFGNPEYELGYWEPGSDWNREWHKADNFYTLENVPNLIPDGNATQVTDGQSLTAAFESGFKPGTLDGAGSDTITAAESTSSVIVFGDVMNTDQLLHDLLKDLSEDQLYGAAPLPDYGSGKEVFEWLEDPTNASILVGTRFEGWTHDDSIKYMLQHAEELGCETRVDEKGTTYLVTVNGTVLTLDGSEAEGVTLDTLTGRTGGNDTITGSSASDTIYGQEGDDLLIGDPSDNLDDLKDVTVSAIEEMETKNDDIFKNFLSRVEGTEGDGDDMLFGGTGDDVLIGMGGNDYLNGGHGEDAIFGGSGDDIVVYDPSDFLVDGGQGIDFMVSDKTDLSLDTILSNKDTDHGPLVNNIEVLITGKDALSLTSIDQLAEDYGIKLGTDDQGQETLSLDDRWQQQEDSNTFTFTDGGVELTLQTVLTPQDNSDAAQHVFILNNAN